VTLDGEGRGVRLNGVSDFHALRAAVGRKGSRAAFLYASIYLNWTAPICGASHGRRRAALAKLLAETDHGIR
jgi:hypothetical protein